MFDFFADACNLSKITPPWLQFQVLTPPPIEMRIGALIDYRLKLHGVPIRWRTRIADWDPPYRFADEQVRGPYRRWYHVHTFDEVDGQTVAGDVVEYSAPGGALVNWLLVQRDVERIFTYRRQVLLETFSGLHPEGIGAGNGSSQ